MALFLCAVSAQALLPGNALGQSDRGDPPEVLRAEACLATDLNDFALNTSDPADEVAAALFDRCDAPWRKAVDAMIGDAGAAGLDRQARAEAWSITWAAVRRATIKGLQSQIIALRAHRPR